MKHPNIEYLINTADDTLLQDMFPAITIGDKYHEMVTYNSDKAFFTSNSYPLSTFRNQLGNTDTENGNNLNINLDVIDASPDRNYGVCKYQCHLGRGPNTDWENNSINGIGNMETQFDKLAAGDMYRYSIASEHDKSLKEVNPSEWSTGVSGWDKFGNFTCCPQVHNAETCESGLNDASLNSKKPIPGCGVYGGGNGYNTCYFSHNEASIPRSFHNT